MSAQRLDGKPLAEDRKTALRAEVTELARSGNAPRLAVVLATSDEAARSYARAKARTGQTLGIEVDIVDVARPTTAELIDLVAALGRDDAVDGILLESPLAAGVHARAVQDAVAPEKDVDGTGTVALGRVFRGEPGFVPATAAAVVALLDGHGIEVAGRRVVVLGRSLVVGRPLSQLLLARDATVTVCHSRTADLAAVAREADVVCVAVGRPRFLQAAMVKPGAAVVDVGTTMVDGKLVGDVDYEAVAAVAGAVSPVPGGVGPLTTVMLLENVVRAARMRRGRAEW